MKFYENGSVLAYIQQLNSNNQKMDWPRKLEIILGIASGVSHLHKERVIHRYFVVVVIVSITCSPVILIILLFIPSLGIWPREIYW